MPDSSHDTARPFAPVFNTTRVVDNNAIACTHRPRTRSLPSGFRTGLPHSPRRGVARTVTERTLAGRLSRARSPESWIALTRQLELRRKCGPIHLELEEDAYAGIACWLGREHWMTVVKAVFTARYPEIRPALVASTGGGVSLRTVLAVATEMASAADFRTGRESRLAVSTVGTRTGLGERTVQRARSTLLLLGVATEVMAGRLRTKEERLDSHGVKDKSRGWASVWALHPPKPVDNSASVRPGHTEMAPHPHGGIFWSLPSRKRVIPTRKAVEKAAASRRLATTPKPGRRKRPPLDRKGQLLAAQWLRDRRSPAWARPLSVDQWASALASAAAHGFTGGDINALLDEEARRLGRELTPEHPILFMRWLLNKTDLDFPPHVLDAIARAQEAETQAAESERTKAMVEEGQRKRAQAIADLDGPGRAAARAIAQRCAQKRTFRTS